MTEKTTNSLFSLCYMPGLSNLDLIFSIKHHGQLMRASQLTSHKRGPEQSSCFLRQGVWGRAFASKVLPWAQVPQGWIHFCLFFLHLFSLKWQWSISSVLLAAVYALLCCLLKARNTFENNQKFTSSTRKLMTAVSVCFDFSPFDMLINASPAIQTQTLRVYRTEKEWKTALCWRQIEQHEHSSERTYFAYQVQPPWKSDV